MRQAKPSVLFVDSNQTVLDGMRRLVLDRRLDWLTYYVKTPREALESIVNFPPDVIIADLFLPPVYGETLLEIARRAHPEIIRMVLSAETDRESEQFLRSTQSAQQFLTKPCRIEELETAVQRALNLRHLLRQPRLVRIIGGIPNLPSLPPLYNELARELESDTASLDRIGDIISKDLSMTARLLHLVNSALFGLPRRITSPKEAAGLLGINMIKSLVLYVKLFYAAPESPIPGLSLDDIWAHSSLASVLSREIVRAERGTQHMTEEAMLAGMMHDFGKLLIMDADSYIRPILRRFREGEEFTKAEYAEYATSHAEIGAYLLGLWGFPDAVVEAVACHHRPSQLHQGEFSLVTAVHVANAVLENAAQPVLDEEYLADIGMTSHIPDWIALCNRHIGKIRG